MIEHGNDKQRQSTFLSEPISPAPLQKKSDSYKPRISPKGMAALDVLSLFNGGKSTVEIAEYVLDEHGAIFPTLKLAELFEKALVEQYDA